MLLTEKKPSMRSSGPTEGKPATVCILGAGFGTSNLGVSALASGTIHAALRAFPGAELFFLDYGREPVVYEEETPYGAIGVSLLNIRFSKKVFLANNIAWLLLLAGLIRLLPSRNWRDALRRKNVCFTRIVSADVVASLAGGDSFSDIYGMARLLYVTLPQVLVLWLEKPLISLPQTYGPFNSRAARMIARYILRRARSVYSRDSEGLALAKELTGRTDDRVRFGYDMGIALEPALPRGNLEKRIQEWKNSGPLAGLNVSGLLYAGGYTGNNMFGLKTEYRKLVRDIVDLLIVKCNLQVILVPHVLGGKGDLESDAVADEELHQELAAKYGGRLHCYPERLDQHETKHVIGRCDFFLGSRMHACIAALSQGVPAVGLAYSGKFAGVLDSLGAGGRVIDLRTTDAPAVLESISKSVAERESLRAELQRRMPAIKASVLNLFATEGLELEVARK
jgi:polysaccharide pyruvyl transferase WcaK-like protein